MKYIDVIISRSEEEEADFSDSRFLRTECTEKIGIEHSNIEDFYLVDGHNTLLKLMQLPYDEFVDL